VLFLLGIVQAIRDQMAFKTMMGSLAWANNVSEITGARYSCRWSQCGDTAHSEMHFLFDAMENGTKS